MDRLDELKVKLFDLTFTTGETRATRVINGYTVPEEGVEEFTNLYRELIHLEKEKKIEQFQQLYAQIKDLDEMEKGLDSLSVEKVEEKPAIDVSDIINAAKAITDAPLERTNTNYMSGENLTTEQQPVKISKVTPAEDSAKVLVTPVKVAGSGNRHKRKKRFKPIITIKEPKEQKDLYERINKKINQPEEKDAYERLNKTVNKTEEKDAYERLNKEVNKIIEKDSFARLNRTVNKTEESKTQERNPFERLNSQVNKEAQEYSEIDQEAYENAKKQKEQQKELEGSKKIIIANMHLAPTTLRDKLIMQLKKIPKKIEELVTKAKEMFTNSPRAQWKKSVEKASTNTLRNLKHLEFDEINDLLEAKIAMEAPKGTEVSQEELDKQTYKYLNSWKASKPGEAPLDAYKRITTDPKKVTVYVGVDSMPKELQDRLGIEPDATPVLDENGNRIVNNQPVSKNRVLMNIDRGVYNAALEVRKAKEGTQLTEDETKSRGM